MVYPGDLSTPTGGYLYDRRIATGLNSLGWEVSMLAVDASFPTPTPTALANAGKRLAAVPDGQTVIVDGLALGGMPQLIENEADRLCIIALIHHPLAAETGLSRRAAESLRQAEMRALATVRRVVVTSRYTARSLRQYGVAPERIGVVEPGTDPAPLSSGSEAECLQLLCVATLTPRKGHAVLFDALEQIRDRDWRLSCVGSLRRSDETVASLRQQLLDLRLNDRVELLGEVDDDTLEACYHQADLFVLASFHEGYGMVLAEALAHGLPIVSTRTAAIPDTVPTNAGLLVPPGDSREFANALKAIFDDAELRSTLKQGAFAARAGLKPWRQACIEFQQQLELSRGQ